LSPLFPLVGLLAAERKYQQPSPTFAEACGEKIEDAREVVTASISSVHAEAGPSEAAREKLMEESLLERPTTPTLEAPP
jgi:hypothetical protein